MSFTMKKHNFRLATVLPKPFPFCGMYKVAVAAFSAAAFEPCLLPSFRPLLSQVENET